MAQIFSTRELPALDLTALLSALEATIPVCAALFDGDGRLLWLSRAASQRYELQATRLNEHLVVTGNLSKLAMLREVALAVIDGNDHFDRWGEDLTKGGEELHTQTCSTSTSADPLVLVAVVSWVQPSLMTKEALILEGLSPREADTALLAARGFSNFNIAATLGLSPSTSATYLKRVFCKLNVHSRSELSYKLHSSSE